MTERVRPRPVADERTMLDSWLDYHRATLETKCAGLPDAELARCSAPPSDLSLHGLVRHMAQVERGWFCERLAGADLPWLFDFADDDDEDFHVPAGRPFREDLALWQQQVAAARATAAAYDLDDTFEHPRMGATSLRWVVVHMIEEYARHNGHADLLRERIDGAVGD